MSARDRIRSLFEANVGKVLTTHQIRRVAGISEYARRIRELRDEEGMRIRSFKDDHRLKPDQYILVSLDRDPAIRRGISPQLRMEILERNGFTCQACGATAGDQDPLTPHQKLRLHIDHVIPISQGGTDDRDNLRVLCSACNQGRANLQTPTETVKNVLARIRRMPRSEQKAVFEALKRTFDPA